MKLAWMLKLGTKPAFLATSFLVLAGSLYAQDVFHSNPELWGPNAHQKKPTSSETKQVEATTGRPGAGDRVIATAQHNGLVKAAKQAERHGQISEASQLYEQALRLAPTDRTTLLSYGRMLHRTGDFAAAVGIYYRSLEVHRDDPVALNDLALCYARQGEYRHALAMMNGAVTLKPDSQRYRNNIAKLLLELNRPNDAFAHLVEGAGPAIGHFNMGQMLSERGQQQEAIKFLEFAVEMDPTLQPAIVLLTQLRASPIDRQQAAPTKQVVEANSPQRIARLPAIETGSKASNPTSILSSASHTDRRQQEIRQLPKVSPQEQASRPGVKELWIPGSIQLQSANIEVGTDAVEFDALDLEANVDEQDVTVAPIPFDSPLRPRRYTKPTQDSDSVGNFLDRFWGQQ